MHSHQMGSKYTARRATKEGSSHGFINLTQNLFVDSWAAVTCLRVPPGLKAVHKSCVRQCSRRTALEQWLGPRVCCSLSASAFEVLHLHQYLGLMSPTRVAVVSRPTLSFSCWSVLQLFLILGPSFGDNSRLGSAEAVFEVPCFGEVEHFLLSKSVAGRSICCFSQEGSGVQSQNEPAKH